MSAPDEDALSDLVRDTIAEDRRPSPQDYLPTESARGGSSTGEGVWAGHASVHRLPPVHEEPEAAMSAWSVRDVASGARHIVGWARGEGRTTSAIAAWDPQRRIAVTQRGRQYQLDGPPGVDGDAEYVSQRWCDRYGLDSQAWTDVSAEYAPDR